MDIPTIDIKDFEQYQGTDYLGHWLHNNCQSYRSLRVGDCKAMLQDLRTLVTIICGAGIGGITVDELIEEYLRLTPKEERGFTNNFSAGALDILIQMGMAEQRSGTLRILDNGEFFVSEEASIP